MGTAGEPSQKEYAMATTSAVGARIGAARKNENDVDLRIGADHRLTERLTAEAQRLLNFAAWIGAQQSAAHGQLSVLSPFIALLASTDRVSRALPQVAAHGQLSAEQIAHALDNSLIGRRSYVKSTLPRRT